MGAWEGEGQADASVGPRGGRQASRQAGASEDGCSASVAACSRRRAHTTAQGVFIRGDMYIRDMKNTKGHVSSCTGGQWHPTDK